ncbi:hypothetical protein MMC08_000703 [Hypocenomyce scalaris]|nr:hypothetical protein [Hypocenomyce scalaris]
MVQDLNIDLQGLADSLSKLPIWTLLNLDADVCQSFVRGASQEAEPGTNRHHDTPLQPSISNSTTGAAAKISSNIQSTASNALDMASEAGPAASIRPVPDQPEAKSISIGSKTRLSSALPAEKSITADAVSPQQKTAPEKGQHAPPGDEHLDLDDLLNAHGSAMQPTSTAIAKPQSQDHDSLEDWLNSL